jgi:hypothetical protein
MLECLDGLEHFAMFTFARCAWKCSDLRYFVSTPTITACGYPEDNTFIGVSNRTFCGYSEPANKDSANLIRQCKFLDRYRATWMVVF